MFVKMLFVYIIQGDVQLLEANTGSKPNPGV